MNTTSNAADISAYYAKLTYLLYSTACFAEVIIGILGAVLSCIVFGQKTMRENPASIYFITFNVNNIFYLMINPLSLALESFTNYSLISHSTSFCKIFNYTTSVCAAISRYCLVLASVDRTLVTSENALMRRRSTYRLAYQMVSGMILLVGIFYAHVFVGFNIYQIAPGTNVCNSLPGVYNYFNTYSVAVVNNIIPLPLMIIFAVQTLRNLSRRRIHPTNVVPTTMTTKQFRDRQLTILILTEIVVYCSFAPWGAAFRLYIVSTQFIQKSVQQQAVEQFIQIALGVSSYVPATLSFYQNLIVSKAFRQKTVTVFFNRCQRRPIDDRNQHAVAVISANRLNLQ